MLFFRGFDDPQLFRYESRASDLQKVPPTELFLTTFTQHTMRRIARIDRSISLRKYKKSSPLQSPYLCFACAAYATSFSTSSTRTARPITYTDRLRNKIWGTDSPPGLDDPYGGASILEKKMQRGKAPVEEETETEETTEAKTTFTTPASTYVPAETWDGLEEVGGEQIWESEHPFQSFVPSEVAFEDEVITLNFHRALVEVYAARQAGQPLFIVSQAEPGDYLTLDVQLIPSATGATLRFPKTMSLEEIVQSLSPEIDETKEKGAPTESEGDVAADRSTVDPLHPDSTSVKIDGTATKEAPTESEEDVAADRSTVDPLRGDASSVRTYADVITAWDPSWLQVSLEDPEVKFAVSSPLVMFTIANQMNRFSSVRCS